MDGWSMDGGVEGWMDGCVSGRMDAMYLELYKCAEYGWKGGWVGRCGWMDGDIRADC